MFTLLKNQLKNILMKNMTKVLNSVHSNPPNQTKKVISLVGGNSRTLKDLM